MLMYVWLVVGFVLLIKGADYFVEASSSIARALRVPGIIIGHTIVAFGRYYSWRSGNKFQYENE